MTYKLVRIEEVSSDPALRQIVQRYVEENLDSQTVQAAAWHLSNKLSWETLENKQEPRLGGLAPRPYFTEKQLTAAKALVVKAQEKAKTEAAAPKL